jgi:RNA polymerase sigma-70 factor (ECF subfamily)
MPRLSSPPDPVDDVRLVDLARGGDRAAFATLVARHSPALRVLVRRYLRDDDDVDEVVQRALVRAYDAMEGFRGDSSFRTWLSTIATNLALNHLRDRGRFREATIEEAEAITNSLATNRLVARETCRRLQATLTELPAKQRTAVELRLLHDLSFREVADVLGTSEDSAKANFHHGLKRLREALGEGS